MQKTKSKETKRIQVPAGEGIERVEAEACWLIAVADEAGTDRQAASKWRQAARWARVGAVVGEHVAAQWQQQQLEQPRAGTAPRWGLNS